jgi:hypothetical protein
LCVTVCHCFVFFTLCVTVCHYLVLFSHCALLFATILYFLTFVLPYATVLSILPFVFLSRFYLMTIKRSIKLYKYKMNVNVLMSYFTTRYKVW